MVDGSKVVAAGEDLGIRTEDILWEDEMDLDTVVFWTSIRRLAKVFGYVDSEILLLAILCKV